MSLRRLDRLLSFFRLDYNQRTPMEPRRGTFTVKSIHVTRSIRSMIRSTICQRQQLAARRVEQRRCDGRGGTTTCATPRSSPSWRAKPRNGGARRDQMAGAASSSGCGRGAWGREYVLCMYWVTDTYDQRMRVAELRVSLHGLVRGTVSGCSRRVAALDAGD